MALPFESGNRPLLRVVLVQGDGESELILAVHHSIGDGVSAIFLVRDLLKFMEGYELEELPPRSALEDLVPTPPAAPTNQLQPSPIKSSGVNEDHAVRPEGAMRDGFDDSP